MFPKLFFCISHKKYYICSMFVKRSLFYQNVAILFRYKHISFSFLFFIFMTLYVGNIAFSVSNEELEQEFGKHGAVTSAKIVIDRETGRSRGFAFVEMADDEGGNAAI